MNFDDRKLRPALEALDRCDIALARLSQTCCEPDRSPRMDALAQGLTRVRSHLDDRVSDGDIADRTLTILEEMGAEIGRLQVACCAPNRTPLYETLLAGLNTTQVTLTRELGRGH